MILHWDGTSWQLVPAPQPPPTSVPWTDEIPLTQQTFADVPPTQPFWLAIERVVAHGVISGYADGTFRPGAPVTRAQTAKIVANTFFPGCQTP